MMDSRFWSKVDRSGGEEACWEWQGPLHKGGYGRFAKDKRHKGGYAHRDAYEMMVGPIPDWLCVCHRCDNRKCVNPKHLFVATHDDNMKDMSEKGRGGGKSEYGRPMKDEIRLIATFSGMSHIDIGRLFGVLPTTVSVWVHRGRNKQPHFSGNSCGVEF